MAQPRKKTATVTALPAAGPPAAPASEKTTHPYRNLDRASRAALARMTGGVSPYSIAASWSDWALHLARSPGRQLELAERAQANAAKVLAHATAQFGKKDQPAPFAPKDYDHRFKHPSWEEMPFSLWKQGFLAMEDWWNAATEPMPGLGKGDADRTRFQMRQALDLVAPSNFPWSNPEIVEETVRTGGKNLVDGAAHFADDLVHTLTQMHRPAPEGFRIGEDLACTPGKVVFRNELFELIQYAPQTEKVRPEPVLIVPAWIMKYYILDLSPHNSMVNYLVSQGFTVFMISWCNPDAEQAELSLEDYRRNGVMAAFDAIGTIVPGAKAHAIGYCLGGTLLGSTLGYNAVKKDKRIVSATFFVALLDFSIPGELGVFIDEQQVASLEKKMQERGYLEGSEMGTTFNMLRSNDLIWSFVVNNYLMGKEPFPFDLLYWNSDSTRMPYRMHSFYLRNMYMKNLLKEPGGIELNGVPIDISKVKIPAYFISTIEDHIAPWKSTYLGATRLGGPVRFVLGGSGHIAGIVNPPSANKYHFWTNEAKALPATPEDWFEGATQHPGSWWTDWQQWIGNLNCDGGGNVWVPARDPAKGKLKALEDAPGSFVKFRLDQQKKS